MLTLNEYGTPFAIVHGGEDDSEVISIVSDPNLFDYEDDTSFEILDDGDMHLLPDLETRQVYYIAGPSGSGKSTQAADYAIKFQKCFPGKNVFIFSRLAQDPAFDGKLRPAPIRIAIDNSLITKPIDITKQINDTCLVIFDDIDTIIDDKLKKAVGKVQMDILEIGRHKKVYIICTCHLINPNDRKFGRTILNEAHLLTVFPQSGSTHQISYCLKTYFGLDKNQIDEILHLPSRWVTIKKGYPQCVIYDKGAYLL